MSEYQTKLHSVPSGGFLTDRDMDKKPILDVRELGIDFGGLTAVDNFNLMIGRNEIAGLIGPNGAGKTTTIKMLSCLTRPDGGDARLLAGSRVRMIATATIGFDHIDLGWCAAHGIRVTTAAGCNARGVLQWIGAALVHLARVQGWQPDGRTLGIVGVGHVGSLVKEYAEAWGFRVLCCDPPREERERCLLYTSPSPRD